jgi:hypothetical protein
MEARSAETNFFVVFYDIVWGLVHDSLTAPWRGAHK